MAIMTAQLPITSTADAVRPFRVSVPETALADLRRRLAQARLPEQETVTNNAQGVPLKTIRQLLRYWQSDYDWRKVEARLNAVPNFITEIDGLEVAAVYSFQQMIEVVHQESDGLQIEAIIRDKKERTEVLNSVKNNEAIRDKAKFAFKYMSRDISLPRRLFAFCIAEGLHFQASFATLAYFRLLPSGHRGVARVRAFVFWKNRLLLARSHFWQSMNFSI